MLWRLVGRWSSAELLVAGLVIACLAPLAAQAQSKPRFDSKLVTSETPGHAVNVDVDLSGAKTLFLVVTDGGNGFSCDWADWAEPRLVGPKGEIRLTELKWKSAATQWGEVRINKNAAGGELKINGKRVEYGIGTHANSVIVYDLPEGVTRLKARAGLDNGGTDQGGGRQSSVQFFVYTEKPPEHLLASAAGNGADAGQRDPAHAVANLDVAEGLQVQLFAAEPTLLSPTNIDVDHRGRVWVCEVVNYRHRNNSRPEGDRILILEDTNGDGQADNTKVYYQSRDIDSAMGICVLGNKVIVSCSPNIFVFTDEDGDDKPDRRELLFTGTGQPQHDHSAHAFVFGPDGWLYWNFGNTGQRVMDKEGKQIADKFGHAVIDNGKPYWGGMVFRCRMDGSDFQVLGHNFRNNYEVAVDSFGTLWQSDNDDDGNRGVRINYVMEYGNFGYRDEITGAGWQTPRTNLETEIPLRHWHLNDPGVVPNLLQTGGGSPCGICVYEGTLLPRIFHNQVIHCDAGPNVVRAYPVQPDGAGYKAEMVNILHGARDQWFRPCDVCVAPDGSLLIADWYDPGVGGHRMGDIERGRIFRVAPPGTPYKSPQFDFATARGACEALASPNHAARYLAWQALHNMGKEAEDALRQMYLSNPPRLRARALYLLGNIPGRAEHYIHAAINDGDANIRIAGLRLARSVGVDVIPLVDKLSADASPAVRRECALALRGNKDERAAKIWAQLAARHDGQDRWYLEALGIGAEGQWDRFLDAYLETVDNHWRSPAGRDIIWRSRARKTPRYLADLIRDKADVSGNVLRYFRAMDFLSASEEKRQVLLQLAFTASSDAPQRQTQITTEAVRRLGTINLNDPRQVSALNGVLDKVAGTSQFVELVDKLSFTPRYGELLKLAQEQPGGQVGVDAVRVLLAKNQKKLISEALTVKDPAVVAATLAALGNSADDRAAPILLSVMQTGDAPPEVRRQAAKALAKSRSGAERIVQLAQDGKLDDDLKQAAALELHLSAVPHIKAAAEKLFPLPAARDAVPLPPLAELVKMRGDAVRGKQVFATTGTCAKCHVVNSEGKDVGPNLSEIGAKLSREAILESILYPSAGISHNYETTSILLVSGNVLQGIVVSETAEELMLKNAEGLVQTIKTADIEQKEKQKISLMPADLQKLMSAQDLADVTEYLLTLKKAAK